MEMAMPSYFLSARLCQHCSAFGDLHSQMLRGEVGKSKRNFTKTAQRTEAALQVLAAISLLESEKLGSFFVQFSLNYFVSADMKTYEAFLKLTQLFISNVADCPWH